MSAEEVSGSPIGLFEIDLRKQPPHEAAALALTLLTYPPAGSGDDLLSQRFGAICAYLIRRRSELDHGFAEDLQLVRPMHALISEDHALRAGRALADGLEKCLTAGEMAIAFIESAALGSAARLPSGVRRLSQNQMAEHILRKREGGTAENVKNREFYPNRPVFHLCAALAWIRVLISQQENEGSLVDLLAQDMALLRAVILLAQDFEPHVLASEKLGVTDQTIVRIRWVEDQVHINPVT